MTFGDTIVAPTTPYGHSSVAIIRISGSDAAKLLSKLSGGRNFSNRRATLSSLKDLDGNLIDRCLVTVFLGPGSYTGEDVVEIYSHGNPSIVEAFVNTICDLGGRLAEPGEFTRRSFLNGKIDLVQAEAVAALVRSKSIEASRSQQKVLGGSLSKILAALQSNLSALLSRIEHQLDISEEAISLSEKKSLSNLLVKIMSTVNHLKSTFSLGRLLNRGATVVIVGETNVGKSTLLNCLAGLDRAIVSHIPGTTRDSIEVELLLGGVPVLFIDTAGLRATQDVIEEEGVRRTYRHIKGADLIVSLTDNPDKKHFTQTGKSIISVLNKKDLRKKKINDKSIIHISAKTNTGIEALKNRIVAELGINKISTEDTYLSTNRQYRAIDSCGSALSRAKTFFDSNVLDVELLSFEIRASLDAIDTLLGKTSPDDILNRVFATMCVGK
ncbi:MAG: tRNA uridine-5-carboxymethylaminomethyl(34) synthesis GTPase MnmE [Candidatus Marinimicrobia bacterium]|nr:tRNA uridine-5-carboxymethylaminomethyl(34) synthesis GTPase MnmE [Candidatus Neomarinimicrobiota bacterium]